MGQITFGQLVDDPRPIRMIEMGCSDDPPYYAVSTEAHPIALSRRVDSITVYTEQGPNGPIPWLFVRKDQKPFLRIPAHFCCITYDEDW